MTPKTQASQIVQKHFKIIESHLLTYPITDDHKMAMAKKHAEEEVRGIMKRPCLPSNYAKWESVLREIQAK